MERTEPPDDPGDTGDEQGRVGRDDRAVNGEATETDPGDGVRRRQLLGSVLSTTAFGLAGCYTPDTGGDGADDPGAGGSDGRPADESARQRRRRRAVRLRRGSIEANLLDRPVHDHPTNDDGTRFGRERNYFAVYSKGLPHDRHGEVDPDAFEALREAVETENGGDFDAIPQAGERPLTNPEAAVSYNPMGIDPNDVCAPAAPACDSPRTAAETVELYWMALLRDVPFREYGSDDLVSAATDELAGLTDLAAPTAPGAVFRGTVPGARRGPHVSQFLYKDFERGVRRRDQLLRVLDPGVDYLTDYDEWLAVQNGQVPNGGINRTLPGGPSSADAGIRTDERYIVTGRDLATFVLENTSEQPYVNAALILQNGEEVTRGGLPLDEGMPVGGNVPAGFVDYSRSGYQSLVAGIVQAHKHAAWYHKWRVHRRLRPEEYGGRLYHVLEDTVVDGQSAVDRYPIDDQLTDSRAVERSRDRFDTPLLPQAYPEGSPTHPSYPGGHAVSAGSCTTVLKAYFDEDAVIQTPVRPAADGDGRYTELEPIDAELTVGGELNKLAANMSHARSWAGIHYRSDSTAGLRIGERVATSVLRDRLRHRSADAYGSRGSFTFTTFDGATVRVTADGVAATDGSGTAFDPPLF